MRVRSLAAVCAALAVALTACSGSAAPAPSAPSDVTKQSIPFDGDWGWVKQPVKTELGVTHTQDSLNEGEPAAARQSGTAILADNSAIFQNQHIMGWGALQPRAVAGQATTSAASTRAMR